MQGLIRYLMDELLYDYLEKGSELWLFYMP